MINTGSTNPNMGNNNFEIYNWPNYTPMETNRLSTVKVGQMIRQPIAVL